MENIRLKSECFVTHNIAENLSIDIMISGEAIHEKIKRKEIIL